MYELHTIDQFGDETNSRFQKFDSALAAMQYAINLVSAEMIKFQKGNSKRAYIDCVGYDGKTVVRAVESKHQRFIYRIAVIKN